MPRFILKSVLSAVVFGTALPAQATAPVAAKTKADALLECMRANLPTALSVQEFRLSTKDRSGSLRELTGRLYAQRQAGRLQLNMKLHSPQNLSGAAYLVRESLSRPQDEMYLYLPAVGRTRRLSGSGAQGPLLGTDFSYSELKLAYSSYDRAAAQQLPDQEWLGANVQRLKLTPQSTSPYQQVQLWVEPRTCVVLRADFYQGRQLRKQVNTPRSALVEDRGHWYAQEVQLKDLLTQTESTLRTGAWNTAAKLSPAVFNPKAFDRVH